LDVITNLSDYAKSESEVLMALKDSEEYLVVDNSEKYKVNIFLVQNKDNE
jgi:hypothetical protein